MIPALFRRIRTVCRVVSSVDATDVIRDSYEVVRRFGIRLRLRYRINITICVAFRCRT